MSLVKGEDVVFEIYDGGVWKSSVCQRGFNLNLVTEDIETTVAGTGNWRTYEPTVGSYTGAFDGIIGLNMPGFLTFPEIQALQIARTTFPARITETAQDGTVYVRNGYFYITNSIDTGSFDGMATYSVSLKGTGKLGQSFTPPSPILPIVYRYPQMGATAPVAPGTVSVTITGLGNKNILAVHKDGIGNNDIIIAGSPVDKEVLYETSGSDGVFTWAIPFDGENFYILYQNT